MKDITVLFTCSLGDYMESTIKCVKRNFERRKIRVIGTDIRKMEYNFNDIDKQYVVPRCDDAHYVDYILSICKEEKVDVLIPTNTTELERFEEKREEIENEGIVLASAGKGISFINSKDRLDSFLKSIGLESVPSKIISSYEEAVSFMSSNGLDKLYCIKKLFDCGARGFRMITSSSPSTPYDKGTDRLPLTALEDFLEMNGPMMMQEYLPGTELTVDMLCDNGETLYSIVKSNYEMVNGVAQISKVIKCSEAVRICSAISKEAKLCGNVGFDLKYSANGSLYVIDANPRLTATVALSVFAGVNLPYLGIKYALGEEIPHFAQKYGARCVRRTKDYFFESEDK